MRNCVGAIACLTAAWLGTTLAFAQVTDDVVKIGVLADMSGLYSDLSSIGSVAPRRWPWKISAARFLASE
jgi:branched-chain amino acid transport system substrate-binding protein